MGNRKGVVGELLIIVVLLASTLLITTTFTDENDTPDIPKHSLEALRDVKTLLSRAIIQWMREGVTDQPLACNGLYAVDSQSMLQALEPYVTDELASSGDGSVQVSPGVLEGIEFDGISSLRITLANGSVIYDDGNIYAEDLYDKDYLFNIRLPLALQVVQDWIKCDAGNLSRNLQEEFGESCFFGKKNPGYGDASGNVCLRVSYTLDEADRKYMLRYAPTPEQVSKAVSTSVDELNKQFAGETTCKQPILDDTGISCTFALEDLAFEYNMNPWSSEDILVAKALDYEAFSKNDDHVHRLLPEVRSFSYDDEQLGCAEEPREPVDVSISPVPYETGEHFVDVKTGDIGNFYANPVLYVNTTRGAKFTLVVTCKDSRAALLGQPLEYTFKMRHGIKQHCGPTEAKGARHRCGACNPMPAGNLDRCITPGKTAGCNTYYDVCAKGIVWEYLQKNPDKRGSTYAALVGGSVELQEMINDSCETVPGFESQYPPPQPPTRPPPKDWDGCTMAYRSVCCGAPGYPDDGACADPLNINNPDCFLDKANIVSLCYAHSTCGEKQCYETKCDASNDYACDTTAPKPEGSSCNTGGGMSCNTCQQGEEGMECRFDDDLDGKACSVGQQHKTGCVDFFCRKETRSCESEIIPAMIGEACRWPGSQAPKCSVLQCNSLGQCMPEPADEGELCESGIRETETQICTFSATCQDGYCTVSGETCEDKTGGGCRCARDEYGVCPAECR